MPHHAAACRVFTVESEGARVGIQTHNAGVAGSSPAPAITQDAQPHELSGALTLRSPNSATTGATTRPKNDAQAEPFRHPFGGWLRVVVRWILGAPPALPTAYIPREADRPAAPTPMQLAGVRS